VTNFFPSLRFYWFYYYYYGCRRYKTGIKHLRVQLYIFQQRLQDTTSTVGVLYCVPQCDVQGLAQQLNIPQCRGIWANTWLGVQQKWTALQYRQQTKNGNKQKTRTDLMRVRISTVNQLFVGVIQHPQLRLITTLIQQRAQQTKVRDDLAGFSLGKVVCQLKCTYLPVVR